MTIEEFKFDNSGKKVIEGKTQGKNWPVVYLISNNTYMYIGETTSVSTRIGQHLKDKNKTQKNLTEFRIVFDDEYNKSVILDYEQRLIKCFKTDRKYKVINRNAGQSASHNYYQRDIYSNKFNDLWDELVKKNLANKSLSTLENQNLFKYSPYNSLTEEQNTVSAQILNNLCDILENGSKSKKISLVNGSAGTGKTVMAVSLVNSIVNAKNLNPSDFSKDELDSEKVKALLRLKKHIESSEGKDIKVAIVFPMTGIRKTIRKVFGKSGDGLTAEMVIGPCDLKNQKYDIVFVDESHRLHQRKSITNYKSFDDTCSTLGFNKNQATELDWVIKQSNYSVLFYDKNQSIKSSDISYNQFMSTVNSSSADISKYELTTQMRCKGGDTYIQYIRDIMECKAKAFSDISNYEFLIFDDVDLMVNKVRSLYDKYGLCHTVAGFSWEWITNPKKSGKNKLNDIIATGMYDIEIQGNKYIWNLKTEDWVSRKDARDTIGCIHTIQGFDLNYAGIIFGKEIDYDPVDKKITIDLNEFKDSKTKAGCDADTVKEYIINAYTTMMSRGIKGCYIFAYNDKLREYLKRFIRKA